MEAIRALSLPPRHLLLLLPPSLQFPRRGFHERLDKLIFPVFPPSNYRAAIAVCVFEGPVEGYARRSTPRVVLADTLSSVILGGGEKGVVDKSWPRCRHSDSL